MELQERVTRKDAASKGRLIAMAGSLDINSYLGREIECSCGRSP